MRIVVTGASGQVGGALAARLESAGADAVRVSRSGAGHVRADLADPATLRPALEGASALFLLVAGDRPEDVLAEAVAAGVERVVLLSSQGAGTRPGTYAHARSFEDALRGSGLAWTVLRPGGFHSNAFAWAASVRAERTVAAPFGDVALPTIDPADIAEVAAAALLEPGHEGRTYELTGPAALTPRDRAAAIGRAIGAPVTFVELTRDAAAEQLRQVMPELVVQGTLDILGQPLPAERAVGDDVRVVLGREPRAFDAWAVEHAVAYR